jgi:hypothetical protein
MDQAKSRHSLSVQMLITVPAMEVMDFAPTLSGESHAQLKAGGDGEVK